MYHKKRHIHFVGIGGIGMCGIAEVLLNLGHEVSGSDLKASDITHRLADLGAKVMIGHSGQNVHGAEVVVVSSAVPDDNPEVLVSRRDFIPVIPRAEMLAELMRLKYAVAVAGSHGKTTTTSLVGTMLTWASLDPTLVIGGKLNYLGVGARLGQGELMVAEADESDGSFLLLTPTVALVTNIDLEHLNYYRDLEHLKESFLAFINKVPFYGFTVLCLDDPNVQSLLPDVKKRYLTYGLSAQAEISAKNIQCEGWGYSFDLNRGGQNLGRVTTNIPGRHNVLNSLAAAAVGLEMGLTAENVINGLAELKGVSRRLEKKGEIRGVMVLDDYGHHPTEIEVTLATLTECFPGRRRVVVFQPHRYSRTQSLFNLFIPAFNQSDQLIIIDIYSAGEAPLEGVTARSLAEAVRSHGHRDVVYHSELASLGKILADNLSFGDVLLTLGAGNIHILADEILRLLSQEVQADGNDGGKRGGI
ncbi:MAG: UDP-N-acetylmuramate--L-alanine ligase [Candidatus Adiutrix intracellularis]|jgi:UDP-N-acetylmuramate--alanine ligase|nr:UDP-N-acetylmuramate--L-alanine ligase [Candidatus Adiutrix intracellularis]